MHKKGQFFLVAALVIVAILLGVGARFIQLSEPQANPSISFLAEEIKYEGILTMDYTLAKDDDMDETLFNLTTLYALSNPDKDIALVYGNNESISVIYYKKAQLQQEGVDFTVTLLPPDKVNVSLKDGFSQVFPTERAKSLYVYVKKEVGDEIYASVR